MNSDHVPLFSIIIPVYNVQAYLEECINSVLCQTMEDYEVILVDDGSSDDSLDICRRYQQLYDDKIRLICQENQGQLLARRVGVQNSCGRVLLFLDSDDFLRSDALAVIANAMDEYECDLLMYTCSRFGTTMSETVEEPPYQHGQVFEGRTKEILYRAVISGNSINNLAFKAIKRALIDTDDDYQMYRHVICANDLFQLIPILDKAQKCVYINEPLYYYRRGHVSTTTCSRWSKYQAFKTVSQRVYMYMIRWGMDTECLYQYYSRCLMNTYLVIDSLCASCTDMSEREAVIDHYREIANDVYFLDAYHRKSVSTMKWYQRESLYLLKRRHLRFLFTVLRVNQQLLAAYVRVKPVFKIHMNTNR